MFFDRFCIFAISLCILPACAGVNPRSWRRLTARKNSPRMRGGQPLSENEKCQKSKFSPHARGSTLQGIWLFLLVKILPACAGSTHIFSHFSFRMPIHPACAGVTLLKVSDQKIDADSPRMRGDQPIAADLGVNDHTFTPHARGSTFCRRTHETTQSILPARAGVNPMF